MFHVAPSPLYHCVNTKLWLNCCRWISLATSYNHTMYWHRIKSPSSLPSFLIGESLVHGMHVCLWQFHTILIGSAPTFFFDVGRKSIKADHHQLHQFFPTLWCFYLCGEFSNMAPLTNIFAVVFLFLTITKTGNAFNCSTIGTGDIIMCRLEATQDVWIEGNANENL